MDFILVFGILLLFSNGVGSSYAPTGCSFNQGNERATCDFTLWDPPLQESTFGPGDVYNIFIEQIDGTIPSEAFAGIDSKANSTGMDAELKFQCDLENVVLSYGVFTDNLDWIKKLTFESCYIQDGISSYMLSNLTSLEEFTVSGGIIGPVNSETFSGISALKKIVIRADFLDAALPSGFFTSHTSLREIDLRSSGLTSIAADTFTGLNLLTDIDLSENSLTTLPDGLFTSLTSLSTLTLGTNSWDCTCDLAWLSMWSLYTGVSHGVVCTTPGQFSGIALNRAVATLGCWDNVATTTAASNSNSGNSGSSSSDSNADDNSTDNTLTYVALAVAGVACLITIVLATAMACKSCNQSTKGKERGRTKVKPQKYDNTSDAVSRPPSYKSSERLFVNTPIQTHRDVRHQPYIDVKYRP